jgi:hypothetical protein
VAFWTVLQNILGAAGGTALVLLLAKYLGDRSLQGVTLRHSKEQAETQNAFSVGATSHMATVAFDKHIEFCEEYVKEVYKALDILIQDGTAEEPLDPRRFSRIREKWALWLTNEMENKLDKFELKITQIIGGPAQDVDANGPVSNERSITRNIADLREVLRTVELTALRNELVNRSSRKPPHVV